MAEMTFAEIVEAVQKLTPRQKAFLAQMLETPVLDLAPTREELLAELETLRAAGAFENVGSLRNAYAHPALHNLSDEQLQIDIRESAAAWEKELDEFFGDQN